MTRPGLDSPFAIAVLFALFVPIVRPAPGTAQSPRDRLLVDAAWLSDHLERPELVVLHVGPAEDYDAGHIPGARHLDLRDVAAPADGDEPALSLELPAPGAVAATLEALGVGEGSRVVVYSGPERMTHATRVLFTLDWIGLGHRSALLDGGLPAWQAAGGRTVSGDAAVVEESAMDTAALDPRTRPGALATADWLHQHLDDDRVTIVDARDPVHYDGTRATHLNGSPVRKGHVPGAANLPQRQLFDEAMRLRPERELRALFDAAGYQPGDTVVAYCHIGQFATAVVFAARTLGYDVRLYDGSFQEWGSHDHLPVTAPQP